MQGQRLDEREEAIRSNVTDPPREEERVEDGSNTKSNRRKNKRRVNKS